MNTSLRADQISVKYGKKEIISGLDIIIEKGKITTLIGPNGCGKSTLLKTLSRILANRTGTVFLNEVNIKKLSNKAIAKQLSLLLQNPETPIGITVHELLEYARYPHQKALSKLSTEDHEIIHWAMKETNIYDLRDEDVANLSGGQRQRVWIALALAQDTDLILLDEPTTYLDVKHQLEILELLKRLNLTTHKTIVMVLHDMNLASRFSDKLVAMKDGRIIKYGETPEVMTADILGEIFDIVPLMAEDPISEKPIVLTYTLTTSTLSK